MVNLAFNFDTWLKLRDLETHLVYLPLELPLILLSFSPLPVPLRLKPSDLILLILGPLLV